LFDAAVEFVNSMFAYRDPGTEMIGRVLSEMSRSEMKLRSG
jgi:hypothetical protein